MLREIDIQPNDRVVFIHIPKTAGITFSTILHPLLAELPWCPVILPQDLIQIPHEEILQYQLFTGHFYYRLVNKLFPSGFLFMTFLREPISRTISHYEYLIRQETFGKFDWANHELTLAQEMSLKEFVTNNQLHIALDITDLQTKFLGGAVGPKAPATEEKAEPSIEEYIQKASKEMNLEPIPVEEYRFANKENLEKAKRRLEQAAFFGITERFQDSLFLMSFIFGWPPILDSMRLNDKPKAKHAQEPEVETRELIKSKVALDLELYQFGQELFEQRFNEMTQLLVKNDAGKTMIDPSKPLPKELLYQLLQKHYEARRTYRNQKLLKTIGQMYLYSPASHIEGNFGWHTAQTSADHGAEVWSGPETTSGFDLPRPHGKNIWVSFRVLMVLDQEIVEKLSLTINNVPVYIQHKQSADGTFIFRGQVPSQATSQPFLHFVFSIPKTIAPYDVDPSNKDARHLGFLLNWVKLDTTKENNTHTKMKSVFRPMKKFLKSLLPK